eukprot:CAMPEP_0168316822 /NCGR_PEP_ID=MMETSP0210-20121227/19580_1 /TAXON_ID=40633 /ORGANISM="Condylostoma magnum, Strain COL2" /LENGTH=44 /DNA_ID= /DNA_START= /DNA_END= /DNA_ORIENTATION=
MSSRKFSDENSTPVLKETASTKEAALSDEVRQGDNYELEKVLKN